ncbi:MAG: GGDEF domain-containing protein [Candidatus Brocadiia bacterium]
MKKQASSGMHIWVTYSLLSVIPVLFLIYLLLNKDVRYFIMQGIIPGPIKVTLVLGAVGLVLMSLAGIILLRKSFSSINKLAKQAQESYRQVVNEDIKLATNDDAEKISYYFNGLLKEVHSKMIEASRYATEISDINKKLTQMAIKDGLTGLYNHHYIKERLNNELRRAQQFRHSLSLILLDIDDFKQYNDTYGHLSGDRVIQEVADLIFHKIRLIDVPARYGGEEFLVILPETAQDEALGVAETVRDAINAHLFPGHNGNTIHLSISAGLSSYTGSEQCADEIIKCADVALYTAKRKGKNRVVLV